MLGGRQTFGERRQLGCCEPTRADLPPAICEEGRGRPIDLVSCVLVILATVATVVAAVTAVVALAGALTSGGRRAVRADAMLGAVGAETVPNSQALTR